MKRATLWLFLFFSMYIYSKSSAPETVPISVIDVNHPEYCESIPQSLFEFGGKLNCANNAADFAVGIMILALFTILVEIGTHFIEHRLVKTNFTWEFVYLVYKELMIMGLISFCLKLVEAIPATVSANNSKVTVIMLVMGAFRTADEVADNLQHTQHRRVLLFELVHIMIFIRAIIYVMIIVIVYFLASMTWKRWTFIENIEREKTGKIITDFQKWRNSVKNEKKIIKYINPMFWYRKADHVEKINYITVRNRFIDVNMLDDNFPFDVYLKTRLRRLFLEFINIDLFGWSVIFVGAGIYFLLTKLSTIPGHQWRNDLILSLDPTGTILWVAVFGGGIILSTIFLSVYTRMSFMVYIRSYKKKMMYDIDHDGLQEAFLDVDIDKDDNNNTRLPFVTFSDVVTDIVTDVETVEDHDFDLRTSYNDDGQKKRSKLRKRMTATKISYQKSMARYMLFASAKFHFYCLQLSLMGLSLFMAMFAAHYQNSVLEMAKYSPLNDGIDFSMVTIVAWVIPFICLAVFGGVMAPYTVLTSVDNMTNHHTIEFAMKRWDKHVQRDIAKAKAKLDKKTHNPFILIHPHAAERSNVVDTAVPYFSYTSPTEGDEITRLSNLIDLLTMKKNTIEKAIAWKKKQDREEAIMNDSQNDVANSGRKNVFGTFYYDPNVVVDTSLSNELPIIGVSQSVEVKSKISTVQEEYFKSM